MAVVLDSPPTAAALGGRITTHRIVTHQVMTDLHAILTDPPGAWKFPQALQQLLDEGEENLVAEIIEVFKNQTVTRLRFLREAVECGRLNEARAQAHTIKGASSQMGADRLAALCMQIENGTGNLAETAALVIQAELLFEEECSQLAVPQRT